MLSQVGVVSLHCTITTKARTHTRFRRMLCTVIIDVVTWQPEAVSGLPVAKSCLSSTDGNCKNTKAIQTLKNAHRALCSFGDSFGTVLTLQGQQKHASPKAVVGGPSRGH